MKKTISFIILLVISLQSHAQIIIRGVVKSDNSETLPGVSVYIPITDQHTVTDIDGKFQIQYTGTTPLTIIVIIK
ncbi:MAG TPA: carboxypeptidase-like regulatory domain-containing protein, partial [Bacteroidia bacterium]|nr:carboxypeptidase-like regulatory domain-containing protein [Bacteroidia bacterium]